MFIAQIKREREREREKERERALLCSMFEIKYISNQIFPLPETKPDLKLIRTRIQNGDGANGNFYLHLNSTDENIFCVYVDRNNNGCVCEERKREKERERER